MRPLPRSLDPLPGESLPGYLMRLAHRLDLAPVELARHTGLLPQDERGVGPLSHRLLLGLAPQTLDAFAAATRLTRQEAAALTLADLHTRYPPLARSLERSPTTGRHRIDGWLLAGFPRYCPQCLAGDGSPNQQVHGGPWKKEWHLAVTFACPKHECFLQHQCPQCHKPGNRPAGGPLLIRTGARGLHPAQCRYPAPDSRRGANPRACGARLDVTPNPIRPSPELLALQNDILAELDPALPGVETGHNLTDLRLMVGFVAAAWPESRHLVESHLVETVNAHFQTRKERAPGKLRGHHVNSLDKAPADPVVCGTLIGVADELLFADNPRKRIVGLFDAAFRNSDSRNSWARLFARHEKSCSDQMREIMQPLIRTYPTVPGRSTLLLHSFGIAPHHIPAFLEPEWYERFIRPARLPFDDRLLRRSAAIHLVRGTAQCTDREAALILGIPADKMPASINDDRFWIAHKEAPMDFRFAVFELAMHLRDTTAPRVDYQRRRDTLRNWVLPEDAWRTLTARLPKIHGKQPVLDDRKRQLASILVWTHVTGGEHLFAPRPLEQAQPEHIRRAWAARRPTTWHQLSGRPDPGPHYAALRQLLTEYAGKLSQEIDGGDPLTQ
ncbi:TniQ family protein [Streptomyces sp. NPDC001339]|uniref:TniQ family protein n=1 Tax=Streptomyces sp. NPDC001339 TaxID=3364563 RepID=UPI0036C21AB1